MIRSWPSLIIGLVIPVVGVLGGIIAFADTSVFVFGIPLLFFWIFAWFPLTSLCLWISWHFFDRQHYPSDVVSS